MSQPTEDARQPEVPPPDLGRRAVRGAVVTVSAQVARILIQLASVVILARLLTPEHYGLIAMVMAVIGVADVFRDFGLSSAAIQATTLSRGQQINLFWLNTGLGLLLTVLAVLASPLVAYFYGQPALTAITAALAVNFLLNGMATQYRADLNRRMLFRRLAVADVTAPLVGLTVGIAAASQGLGYWALVAQQVSQIGTMLLLVVVGARWLPGRWRRDAPIRPFLSFGWRLAGSQLIGYVGNNIDQVMVGLRVGDAGLGLYNRAYQLVMTPLGQIRGPLNTVAVPVLSRVQHDEPRFQAYVARAQLALGYTLVAGLALAAGAAEPLVAVLLGPSWVSATPLLRLLAIGAAFSTLAYVGYWVYVTKGIVDHLLTFTLFGTIVRIVLIVIGSSFGLIGVAAGMATVPGLLWPVSIWWLSRRAAVPVLQLWLGGVRITIVGAIVGGCAGLANVLAAGTSVWLRLIIALLGGTLAYAALVLVVPPFRRDLASVVSLAQKLRR